MKTYLYRVKRLSDGSEFGIPVWAPDINAANRAVFDTCGATFNVLDYVETDVRFLNGVDCE